MVQTTNTMKKLQFGLKNRDQGASSIARMSDPSKICPKTPI